ncbi:MAG: hypothetical protein ACRCXC_12570 [Legionella sp.]
MLLKEEVQALDDFILSLYDNDNHILEETFEAINDITLSHTPSSEGIEKAISHHVKDDEDARVNLESQSPSYAGSVRGRVEATFASDFKPQHGTSLSTVRHYKSNANSPIREYRFGTQGQRHEDKARVSPLFKRFLFVQNERARAENGDEDQITHVYFNNLGRYRTGFAGTKEKELTEQSDRTRKAGGLTVVSSPKGCRRLVQTNF